MISFCGNALLRCVRSMSETLLANALIKLPAALEYFYLLSALHTDGASRTCNIVSPLQRVKLSSARVMSRFIFCQGLCMQLSISKFLPVGWIRQLLCVNMSSPPLFSKFFDLVPLQKPGKGLVWIIAIIMFTALSVSQVSEACSGAPVGLPCQDVRMCRDIQGVLGSLASKVRERVDETRISWFLDG